MAGHNDDLTDLGGVVDLWAMQGHADPGGRARGAHIVQNDPVQSEAHRVGLRAVDVHDASFDGAVIAERQSWGCDRMRAPCRKRKAKRHQDKPRRTDLSRARQAARDKTNYQSRRKEPDKHRARGLGLDRKVDANADPEQHR